MRIRYRILRAGNNRVVYKLNTFARQIMSGKAGISVNIEDRKEISKKGRQKIRTKMNYVDKMCNTNQQCKKEKKNGKIEKLIALKNCCKLKMLNNYCTKVYKILNLENVA